MGFGVLHICHIHKYERAKLTSLKKTMFRLDHNTHCSSNLCQIQILRKGKNDRMQKYIRQIHTQNNNLNIIQSWIQAKSI